MTNRPTILFAGAMGTRFELVLMDPGERLGAHALHAAGEAALRVIHETEARWSLFQRTSRLAQLNRSGHEAPLLLDDDDLVLFDVIADVHAASRGAFDPNVAFAMLRAGHFDRPERTAQLGMAGSGTWVFDHAARHVRFTGPGPALDLGGVAKGFALDLAGRELEEAGVTCALLHGGTSSVLALGTPPGSRAWTLRAGSRDVTLLGRALAASGSDSQTTAAGGHIRMPAAFAGDDAAAPSARHATVTAPTAALADAWSTALCVDPELHRTAATELAAQDVLVLDASHAQPSSSPALAL